MASKVQHSTTKIKDSEKRTKMAHWIDTYKSPLDMKSVAITDTILERLGEEIVQWAYKDPDAFCITEFALKKGIPLTNWYTWLSKYPEFHEAYDMAREILAVKREKGVAFGTYRDSMIKQVHGHYSRIWRDEHKRVADVEKGSSEATTPFVVVPEYPSTDVVPVLVKDSTRDVLSRPGE
jgi:hypothetical protein